MERAKHEFDWWIIIQNFEGGMKSYRCFIIYKSHCICDGYLAIAG